jgi:hypothetical protein
VLPILHHGARAPCDYNGLGKPRLLHTGGKAAPRSLDDQRDVIGKAAKGRCDGTRSRFYLSEPVADVPHEDLRKETELLRRQVIPIRPLVDRSEELRYLRGKGDMGIEDGANHVSEPLWVDSC